VGAYWSLCNSGIAPPGARIMAKIARFASILSANVNRHRGFDQMSDLRLPELMLETRPFILHTFAPIDSQYRASFGNAD
jgi:hypothetical protein